MFSLSIVLRFIQSWHMSLTVRVTTLISLVLVSLYYHYESNREHQRLNQNIETFASQLQTSLAAPLGNFVENVVIILTSRYCTYPVMIKDDSQSGGMGLMPLFWKSPSPELT